MGIIESMNIMSWSVNFIGKPEKVVEALNAQSKTITDVNSKAEYDAALPHLVALVKETHGSGYGVKLAASGSGYTGGDKPTRQLAVNLEIIYGLLV
jgi:hypothetical protein